MDALANLFRLWRIIAAAAAGWIARCAGPAAAISLPGCWRVVAAAAAGWITGFAGQAAIALLIAHRISFLYSVGNLLRNICCATGEILSSLPELIYCTIYGKNGAWQRLIH